MGPGGRYEFVREGVLRSLDRANSYLVASVTGGFSPELHELDQEAPCATASGSVDASGSRLSAIAGSSSVESAGSPTIQRTPETAPSRSDGPTAPSSSAGDAQTATDRASSEPHHQVAALRGSGVKEWGATLVAQWLAEANTLSTAHQKAPTSWPPPTSASSAERSPTTSPDSASVSAPPTEVESASPAIPRAMDAATSSTDASSAASGAPSTTEAPTSSGATTAGSSGSAPARAAILRPSDGPLFGSFAGDPSTESAEPAGDRGLQRPDGRDLPAREPPSAPPRGAQEAGVGCCQPFTLGHDHHAPHCKVGGYGYVPRDANAWREEWSERSAILEFCAGMSRRDAEESARRMIGPCPRESRR